MKEAEILKTLRDLADKHSRVTVHADVGTGSEEKR